MQTPEDIYKLSLLHIAHLPSKIQISFGLSGKFRANIARLNSGETAFCFLGEVVALGLVALFYLKIHLEDNLEEFLVSLKIFLPFLCLQRAVPQRQKERVAILRSELYV